MDYRMISGTGYIRMNRGDEMVQCILDVCRREGIASAMYTGIGGCSRAETQIFDPAARAFRTETTEGMLELVSFTGNVIRGDDGALHHHTHVLFSCERDGACCVFGGHLKSATVLFTAEIELRPVHGGVIRARADSETGTYFWAFDGE